MPTFFPLFAFRKSVCWLLFDAGGNTVKNNFRIRVLHNLSHINDIHENIETANPMQMKLFILKVVQL
ncbi:MAG: hypothetical protein DBX55_05310 [Verrucomicrobia bacterium]|nr:MAG: hypothetical protein DBX55_05310 [Verrucomicrobiota bacterium]